MGAGKLQERDVVGSLRVLRVLLSEVPVLPPEHRSSVTGGGLWAAGHPPPLCNLTSTSWSTCSDTARVLPVAVPLLQGVSELLPVARKCCVNRCIVAWQLQYQLSGTFFLFSPLFPKAAQGP